MMMKRFLYILKAAACTLVCLPLFLSCNKWGSESTVDPLPFPMDNNKDLSVAPGDDFFQYCNGTWLAQTPTPETGTVGGLLSTEPIIKQMVKDITDTDPSLKRYYQLIDEKYGHQDASKAYLADYSAKFPVPSTREELFRAVGKLIADGLNPFILTLVADWKDGQIIGLLSRPNDTYKYSFSDIDASIKTELSWVVEGMGLNPAEIYYNDSSVQLISIIKNVPVESFPQFLSRGLMQLYPFVSEEYLASFNSTISADDPWDIVRVEAEARGCAGYELSNRLAVKYVSPELKQHFLERIERLREAFRLRISRLDWMSATTRNNALEKLDKMQVFAGYPDTWYEDCLPDLSSCRTLVEAVHILKQKRIILTKHLIGTRDVFSNSLTKVGKTSDQTYQVTDLSLVNAFYQLEFNCIVILPAMMIAPNVDLSLSEAREWAALSVEGHEITHGFDSNGSKYDAVGRVRNWWTVADQMAFLERQEKLIQCYNLMEYDPVAKPGVFADGKRTLSENIADLGGFLIARDAYMVRLQEEGYTGEEFVKQMRKFYEAYADIYCMKYSPSKLSLIMTTDVHSHCRQRVNGVVMNTDMWYDLYNVTRNNLLYLPPERRVYIW